MPRNEPTILHIDCGFGPGIRWLRELDEIAVLIDHVIEGMRAGIVAPHPAIAVLDDHVLAGVLCGDLEQTHHREALPWCP